MYRQVCTSKPSSLTLCKKLVDGAGVAGVSQAQLTGKPLLAERDVAREACRHAEAGAHIESATSKYSPCRLHRTCPRSVETSAAGISK